MKRNLLLLKTIFGILFSDFSLYSQTNENIWFDGFSRTYFARDAININAIDDTISARNISNGYSLLDLNTHVNPIKDIEIFTQLRLKNSFGSFFGSGTEVSVRQLRAKGIINNKIRFSVGDLFLKQSKFTLYNYDEELVSYENDLINPYKDIIHYENFYNENRWRLQGLQADFSYEFDRYIRGLDFDFFVTRPRGSRQINETTYSSDILLSGGSIISQINKQLILSGNYINLFEPGASGTKNISIRNPVHDISLLYSFDKEKYHIQQKLQTGISKRFWLHSELENEVSDSTSSRTQGMYFELDNKYSKKDSTLSLSLGYRYVDPNFRSAGAQTRRLDYNNINSIYPTYTNMSLIRPPSIFDLLSDYKWYNQDLSSILMTFNPTYSNVLPYGDATPNRSGIYINARTNNINKQFIAKINAGFFKEVIGQGTVNKRNFSLFKGSLKVNFDRLLNWKKELNLYVSSKSEISRRKGEDISSINLFSNHINVSANAEIAKKFFIQSSYQLFNSNGNEFLTQRDNYGNITYFTKTQIDQKEHVLSMGMLYKFRKKVYANLNYNWWGMKFSEVDYENYKYNRLVLILSVEL
ncbi:MAG: hypothetical protein CMD02_04575 [Flavobacteriales bacterium]|nr:hypothetical protein [Flavobacteriales bacterium]